MSKRKIITIPNILSFLRILLIPLILKAYLGDKNNAVAVMLIALSAVTDVADGFIARTFHMCSDVGKVLDGFADKLTQAALAICLIARTAWMILLLCLLIVREVLLGVYGYMTFKMTGDVNSARWYGKASTVTVYSTMMVLFLFPRIPDVWVQILIFLCCVMVILSGTLYSVFYYKILRRESRSYGRKKTVGLILRSLGIILWLTVIVACVANRSSISPNGLLGLTPITMALCGLIMLLLFALKSVTIAVYSGLLYAASGLLLPWYLSVPVNILGTAIMGTIPFFLGRSVEEAKGEKLRSAYPLLQYLHGEDGELSLSRCTLSRMVPLLSGTVVSGYMGASSVTFGSYLLSTMVGMLPAMAAFTVLGMYIGQIGSAVFIVTAGAELLITAAAIGLFLGKKAKQQEFPRN